VEVSQEVEWVPNWEKDSGTGRQLVAHNEEAQEAQQTLGLGREVHNLGPRTGLPNMQVGHQDCNQMCCNWHLYQLLPWGCHGYLKSSCIQLVHFLRISVTPPFTRVKFTLHKPITCSSQ